MPPAEARRILFVDPPWPDCGIERALFAPAGFALATGGTAGDARAVTELTRAADPVAVVTFAAPVAADAIAAPRDLRLVARVGDRLDGIAVEAATARGARVIRIDGGTPGGTADARRRAGEEIIRVLLGGEPEHPVNAPRREAEALTGGVSSDIRIVDTVLGPVVVKEALPELKVAAYWPSDASRSTVEAEALRAIGDLLGPGTVPRVLWTDPVRHRFGMERVDPTLRNWKRDLLAGRVDRATARRAGELLGQLHSRSSVREDIAARFASRKFFEELRIRPYFHRIAERNPPLAPHVADAIAGMERSRERALIHGDYSPKNILADGERVVILDCEVAHWGDPRFDIGFCLSHLVLKSLRQAARPAPLLAAADAFLDAYRTAGLTVLDAAAVRITGCLVLARLEGDSPVEYRGDLRPVAKEVAVAMIEAPAADPAAAVAQVRGALA